MSLDCKMFFTFPKEKQWVLLNTQIDASSFPRSSVLELVTQKPIKLSHLEGHLNSLIAPRGGKERGVRLPEELWARIQRWFICRNNLFIFCLFSLNKSYMLMLGGMNKNLYHCIFQNYTGFSVYDGIYFFHDWVLTTVSNWHKVGLTLDVRYSQIKGPSLKLHAILVYTFLTIASEENDLQS